MLLFLRNSEYFCLKKPFQALKCIKHKYLVYILLKEMSLKFSRQQVKMPEIKVKEKNSSENISKNKYKRLARAKRETRH